MATAVLPHISLEEYLHSVYRPDVDFVDGHLEERNLGEIDHSDLQSELIALLRTHSDQWQVRAYVEARVQVSERNFRVPDICVMPFAWKRTQIVTQAPLLCIEILSPEDRMSRLLARCGEFLALGVREVWIFDPAARVAHRVTSQTATKQRVGVLTLAGTPIAVDLSTLFAVLDR